MSNFCNWFCFVMLEDQDILSRQYARLVNSTEPLTTDGKGPSWNLNMNISGKAPASWWSLSHTTLATESLNIFPALGGKRKGLPSTADITWLTLCKWNWANQSHFLSESEVGRSRDERNSTETGNTLKQNNRPKEIKNLHSETQRYKARFVLQFLLQFINLGKRQSKYHENVFG